MISLLSKMLEIQHHIFQKGTFLFKEKKSLVAAVNMSKRFYQ